MKMFFAGLSIMFLVFADGVRAEQMSGAERSDDREAYNEMRPAPEEGKERRSPESRPRRDVRVRRPEGRGQEVGEKKEEEKSMRLSNDDVHWRRDSSSSERKPEGGRSQEMPGDDRSMSENRARPDESRKNYDAPPSEEDRSQMTDEDKAMYEKIMQMPPEQREQAANEYKDKHPEKFKRRGEEMRERGSRNEMSEEDKAMREKIKQMPPEEREQAVNEYREQRQEKFSRSQRPMQERGSRNEMSDEDKAMYEKIKQMPPEQRESAAKEYRSQRTKSRE